MKVALRELRGEVAEYSTWPRSWKRCAKDPSTCADEFILRGVKKQARVLVTAYIEYLEAQAAQKTKRGLPAWFRKAAKPYYPGVDLSKVRYVEGVDTLHKQIITVGNVIFFPGKVNLKRTAGIQTMLHELEHVVQYKQRGSKHQLIYEYVAKIPFKMVSTGRFNVHDDLDMERAADAKADEAWRTVVAAIR